MAPALVTAADIMTIDLDGKAGCRQSRPRPMLERFIHSEIYRARPDVMAVVHSHSPAVIPFGIVPGATLKAGLAHGRASSATARRCSKSATPPARRSDMLVRTPELGDSARESALTRSISCLMRGHGSTVAGRRRCARPSTARSTPNVERQAAIGRAALGQPDLSHARGAGGAARANDAAIDRAWHLWNAPSGEG